MFTMSRCSLGVEIVVFFVAAITTTLLLNFCRGQDDYIHPSIVTFNPKLGPWEGGTNITIEGFNLGHSFNDILSITVAGVPCFPFESSYSSRLMVCYTYGLTKPEHKAGPVVVRFNGYVLESKEKYQFVDPKIHRIFPMSGPMWGGTVLSIIGEYVNAGNRIEISVGHLSCAVISSDVYSTKCITEASDEKHAYRIRMKFDQAVRIHNESFSYLYNPRIYSIEGGTDLLGNPIARGVVAGGTRNVVSGENLSSVEQPRMFVEYNGGKNYELCQVKNDTSMVCLSPCVHEINNTATAARDLEFPLNLRYGIEMGNVLNVQTLKISEEGGATNDTGNFSLFPNPEFQPFAEFVKQAKGDYLVLDGRYLNFIQVSDIIIHIGESLCGLIAVSKAQLTCRLPEVYLQVPHDTSIVIVNPKFRHPVDVVVTVGNNLKYNLGKLKLTA